MYIAKLTFTLSLTNWNSKIKVFWEEKKIQKEMWNKI